MSDDWETAADEIVKAPVVINKWAGEDEVEEDAPDAWDAEPEEKPVVAKVSTVPVESQKVIHKRQVAKKEEEERRIAEKQNAANKNDPSHAAAERERLRRMEEDRDAALAGDLFGAEHVRTANDVVGSQVDSQGAAAAAAAAALNPMAAAVPIPAASVSGSNDSASVVSSGLVVPAGLLKPGARIDELILDTDADVQRLILELGKRFEKLGKSVLASKKILNIISGVMEESVKIGVLRMDEVGELKRIVTVRHNDMNTKLKKGDKKKPAAAAATKPVVALARNAFMHGDNFGSHADENPDDYDFI